VTHLLEMRDLTLDFETEDGVAKVLDRVSFDIAEGEVFGLVGETGCGKTVTALAILRLLPRTALIRGGAIRFAGENLLAKSDGEMARLRGSRMTMVFQDPATSLNPTFPIGDQVARVLTVHEGLDRDEALARAAELFGRVGLPDAGGLLRRYPHELSGGMQQRVMIAMALACRPKLLIADEPTTAVDVTLQAQILDLLLTLKAEFGLSVLLITHNFGIVAETCDRVGSCMRAPWRRSGGRRTSSGSPSIPTHKASCGPSPGRAPADVPYSRSPGWSRASSSRPRDAASIPDASSR